MLRPLFVVCFLLSACIAEPLDPFVMEGECTKTCSDARLACNSRGNAAANRCYSSCYGGHCYRGCEGAGDSVEINCLAEIEDICGDTYGCAEHNFGARLGSAVPEIEEACRAHYAACGHGADPDVCTQFSHVEGIATAEVYECLTANACAVEGCPMPIADTALATATCNGLSECGWDCGAEIEPLARELAWLRPDVRETLQDCLALPCHQGRGLCTATWFAAVYPQ